MKEVNAKTDESGKDVFAIIMLLEQYILAAKSGKMQGYGEDCLHLKCFLSRIKDHVTGKARKNWPVCWFD